MRKTGWILWFPALVITAALVYQGCGSSFEGIRMRGQSPSISEASRRIALAVQADDYRIVSGTILGLAFETDWREVREVERSETEKGVEATARISVQLFQRAALYDIFLTVTIAAGGKEYIPDASHPIVVKWQKILHELVQEEFREEG